MSEQKEDQPAVERDFGQATVVRLLNRDHTPFKTAHIRPQLESPDVIDDGERLFLLIDRNSLTYREATFAMLMENEPTGEVEEEDLGEA